MKIRILRPPLLAPSLSITLLAMSVIQDSQTVRHANHE